MQNAKYNSLALSFTHAYSYQIYILFQKFTCTICAVQKNVLNLLGFWPAVDIHVQFHHSEIVTVEFESSACVKNLITHCL